jgi:hypothetical protein
VFGMRTSLLRNAELCVALGDPWVSCPTGPRKSPCQIGPTRSSGSLCPTPPLRRTSIVYRFLFGRVSTVYADHEDALETEVLTYRAFCDRQLLLAWDRRRRLYEHRGRIQTQDEERVVSGVGWIRRMVDVYRQSSRAVRDGFR